MLRCVLRLLFAFQKKCCIMNNRLLGAEVYAKAVVSLKSRGILERPATGCKGCNMFIKIFCIIMEWWATGC
jgi:hypothetical protein